MTADIKAAYERGEKVRGFWGRVCAETYPIWYAPYVGRLWQYYRKKAQSYQAKQRIADIISKFPPTGLAILLLCVVIGNGCVTIPHDEISSLYGIDSGFWFDAPDTGDDIDIPDGGDTGESGEVIPDGGGVGVPDREESGTNGGSSGPEITDREHEAPRPSPVASDRAVPPFANPDGTKYTWSAVEYIRAGESVRVHLDMNMDWVIIAQFEGVTGATFQRLLIQETPHYFDFMFHGNRLCTRMANRKAWWCGAGGTVGTHTQTYSDHVALGVPMRRQEIRGLHVAKVFHFADTRAVYVEWDGKIVLANTYALTTTKPILNNNLKVGACQAATIQTGVLVP